MNCPGFTKMKKNLSLIYCKKTKLLSVPFISFILRNFTDSIENSVSLGGIIENGGIPAAYIVRIMSKLFFYNYE